MESACSIFKINGKLYRKEKDGQIQQYDNFYGKFVPSNISYNEFITSDKEEMPDNFASMYYYLSFEDGTIRVYKTMYVDDLLDKYNYAFANVYPTKEQALNKAKVILEGKVWEDLK